MLIHGLGGSIAVWRPVIDRLAAERDVIALDLPGFGESPPPGDGFRATPAELAHAVRDHCAEMGIERPHLAGNSLGGWVALEMAANGDAASVCALSPAGLWRTPLGPRRYDAQALGRRLRPVVRVMLASKGGRSRLLRTSVARPERLTREEATALVMNYLDAPLYPAANDAMRAGAFERSGDLEVPVTIAWGAADALLGRPSRTRLPAAARYLEVPGWGHTPTWDDPDGVAELILDASGTR